MAYAIDTIPSLKEDKRDSLRSVISGVSIFSLDFLQDSSTDLNEISGDSTEISSINDSSSMLLKGLVFNGFEFDDEAMPSRKRRASRRFDPSFSEGSISRESHSSGSLVLDDNNFNMLLSTFDTDQLQELERQRQLSTTQMIPQQFQQHLQQMQFFQQQQQYQLQQQQYQIPQPNFHQQAEHDRHRIQSELIARLECLDGIVIENVPDVPPSSTTFDEREQRPEDPEPRLGIYNEKQRIERLNAYREKRKRRVYGKVRYVLRQRVSEARPRVKGRFVKQNSSGSPESDSTSSPSPKGIDSPSNDSGETRRIEFQEIPEETPSKREKRRTAWEMLKSLSLFAGFKTTSPKASSPQHRPSLPATFAEKLLQNRRKSTTGCSTASGKARRTRKLSRDEFFDETIIVMEEEPEKKRSTEGNRRHYSIPQ